MALNYGNIKTPVEDNSAALMDSVQKTIAGDQEVAPPEVQVADASNIAPIMQPVTSAEKEGLVPQRDTTGDQTKIEEKYSSTQAALHNIIKRDYGHYISEVNLDLSENNPHKTTQNSDGTYNNVIHVVKRDSNVSGDGSISSYRLPNGMTREEIQKNINERNEVIRKSGDLTYVPDSPLTSLLTVRMAEDLTVTQMVRGVEQTVPMAIGIKGGKLVYRGSGLLLDRWTPKNIGLIKKGLNQIRAYGSIAAGIYGIGLGYHWANLAKEKLEEKGITEFSSKGWAQILFEIQNKEIEFRKLDPNHVDVAQRPRALTVEQFAEILDPKFASYWTKLANTLTEGGAATFTFGVSTGTMGIRDLDVFNMVLGRNNNRMKKLHNQAIANLKDNDLKLSKAGIRPVTPSAGRIAAEIRRIAEAKDLKDKEEILGWAGRFIIGFERQQTVQKMVQPRKWILEIVGGEFGAGGLNSAAATYNWLGANGRTEDIDKLGYVLAGATLFPNALGFVIPALAGGTQIGRLGSAIIEGTALVPAYGVETIAKGIDQKGRTQLGRYLAESSDNVQSFFRFIGGEKATLPEDMDNAVKKVAIKLKRKILSMDADSAGKITKSMETSVAITQQVGELASRIYPNDLVAKEKFMEQSLGVFTGLEVIGALEDFIVSSYTKGNSVKLSSSAMRLQQRLVDFKQKALGKASELYEDLMKMQGSEMMGEQRQAYEALTNSLAATIQNFEGRTAELNTWLNKSLVYTANKAFKTIINNPYEGQKDIAEVIDMMDSHMGKDVKFTIDGTELTKADAIKTMLSNAQMALDDSYMLALDGRKILSDTFKVNGVTESLPLGKGYQVGQTITGTQKLEISAHHFASTMNTRRLSMKSTKNTLYARAFDNPNHAVMDVTDLYANVHKNINALSSAERAGVDISDSVRFARTFFEDSVEDSVRPFIEQIGKGNYKEGIKVLTKLLPKLKKAGIIINADDLKDMSLLGQVLFSPQIIEGVITQRETINTIFGKAGLPELILSMPTVEFRNGIKNVGTKLRLIDVTRAQSKEASSKFVSNKLFKNILSDLQNDLDIKYKTRNPEAYDEAYKFYTEEYLPMVRSTLWKNSFGGTTGFDPNSPTKLSHEIPVHEWLKRSINRMIAKSDDAQLATSFMVDFRAFFGTDVNAMQYKSAKAALDDTLIQMGINTDQRPILKGVSGEMTEMLEKGKPRSFPTNMGAILPEEVNIKGYGVPAKISTALEENETYNKVQKVIDNLESTGYYKVGETTNVFKKLNRAISEGGPLVTKKINENLDLVAKQIDNYGAQNAKNKASFNSMRKMQQEGLEEVFAARGNTGQMVSVMLEKPETLDAVRKAFIENDPEGGAALFKSLMAEGIMRITESGGRIVKGTAGEMSTQKVYDPKTYNQLLTNNKDRLINIFGTEHVENMLLINQILMRQEFSRQAISGAAGYGGTKIGFGLSAAKNFTYGPASIISRLYAANSGRTSYRYIGAEAVAALLVNSDNKVITALMTNPKWARAYREFLSDPRTTMDNMSANVLTWLHELTAWTSAIGQGVFLDETLEESNKIYFTEQVDKILARGKETYGRQSQEPRSVLDPITQKEQKAIEEAQITVGARNRARDYGEAIEAAEAVKGYVGKVIDFNF
jgi:hypothetical protein